MSFESILLWSLAIGTAIGAALLVVALRGAEPSAIARATALGQYVAALEAADRGTLSSAQAEAIASHPAAAWVEYATL